MGATEAVLNVFSSSSAGDQGPIADAPVSVTIHEWDGSANIKAQAPHGAVGGLGAQLASASCQAKGDAAPVCKAWRSMDEPDKCWASH